MKWTKPFNHEDVLRPGATELLERLIGDDIHDVSRETMPLLLTDDAIEAGYNGDLVWFRQHISSDRRGAAEYPLAVAMRQGARAVFETPALTVGDGPQREGRGGGRGIPVPRTSVGRG